MWMAHQNCPKYGHLACWLKIAQRCGYALRQVTHDNCHYHELNFFEITRRYISAVGHIYSRNNKLWIMPLAIIKSTSGPRGWNPLSP